jgi:hypothetical protein
VRLLQDREDVYEHFVVCVLLNRTRAEQVAPLLDGFFGRWSDAFTLSRADPEEVAGYIRSTGFARSKARNLLSLAGFMAGGDLRWTPDGGWPPGVGKYAMDSYRILFEGARPRDLTDKELQSYVRYLESNEARRAGRARRRRKDHARAAAR